MRNAMLPSVVLFYAILAVLLAVTMVVLRQSSVFGTSAEALSNACENLALIVIAIGVWVRRR
jgi:hypothetical protein